MVRRNQRTPHRDGRADSRLHVLHVVHKIGDGGVDRALTRLVNASDRSRFVHTVLKLWRGSGYEPIDSHVRVLEGDDPATRLRAIERLMRTDLNQYDVVHGWVSRASVLATGIATQLARPLVLLQATHLTMELAFEPEDSKTYWGELRRGYQLADAVVVPSEALVADTEAVCAIKEPVVIPFSVDVDSVEPWRPRSLGGRPFVVGLVCRLCRQKDPLALVDALALVNQTMPCELRVCGDGYLRGDMERRAGAAGVGGRLHFAGFDPEWLARADAMDAFVFPTRFEGLSNGVLEAAAAGMPIVTTDIPENRAVLEHGVDSLLVPPASPELLAAAILDVARNREAAIARGRRARTRVRQFSLERMVSSYEDLYARLASVSGRAARYA
jgi:glycosyltransferase involved in cell wall biosynthesis